MRGKGAPNIRVSILLALCKGTGKLLLFLSERSAAVKAKHQGKCPETSLPVFLFSVTLLKKYQTGTENGNTIFFHPNLLLGWADETTLCKGPLIL